MSYRAGFIGLIGNPNAGKSSLVNALIGEKVSIVSRKPQTTRQRVIGVYTDDQAQALFVDAPGVIESEAGLNKFLSEEYKQVIKDSDALIATLNVDEDNPQRLEEVIDLVSQSGKPWMAVITKNDIPQYNRVMILKDKLKQYSVPVLSVSAAKAPHLSKEDLIPEIVKLLPESPKLYDDEIYTTQNVKDLVAEIVRETCFEYLHQEIPYGLAVKIQRFEESDGLVKVMADLIVSKENHKAMVVGQRGQNVKRIGTEARKQIESLMGKKCFLEVFVVVKKNWMKKDNFMKELGYVTAES